MMSKHGHNFERSAILDWLAEGNACCPVSGKPLRPSNLVSNKALESKIRKWQQAESGQPKAMEPKDETAVLTENFIGLVAVPPKEMICPLTKEVMKDPIMTRDGQSYERHAILELLETNNCHCPLTGLTLRPSDLVPNRKLQKSIFEWQLKNETEISEDAYFMRIAPALALHTPETDAVIPFREKACVKTMLDEAFILIHD